MAATYPPDVLLTRYFEAQNLSRLAFREYLERAATHFAISGETLDGDAGIDQEVETLSTIGTLN